MTFTLKQLSVLKGVDVSTMRRYLKKLKADGKFQKLSIGKFYSEAEARKIAALTDFEMPKMA